MSFLRGFGMFWYDFIVGDDWKLAAAVVVVAGIGCAFVSGGVVGPLLPVFLGVCLAVAFTIALLIDVRATKPKGS